MARPTLSGGSLFPTIATATRTAGNVTFSSTTVTDVDTGLDLVLIASIGDVIEYNINALVQGVGGVDLAFDVYTIVASSPVNPFGTGLGVAASPAGIIGWYRSAEGVLRGFDGAKTRTLVAGDLSSGTVTLRLRGVGTSGTSRILYADAADPLSVWAKNYGH